MKPDIQTATLPLNVMDNDEREETLTAVALIYLRVSTSRQARKENAAEGYSIPAQRELCTKKARELKIADENIEEFVDAGASARSADRDGLQALLERIEAGTRGEAPPVKYVIVHKLDRLARDRFDDVTIQMAIVGAGAQLVSVSEQIDDTPSGMLMHGIMATIAEFYSRNLSTEAKKGIEQKVRNGGTPGRAPIGYTNVQESIKGCDVRSIAVDEERAPLIRWAFEEYATGEWSISELTAELKLHGLRSRETRVYVSKPLSRAQVHRILTSPYYIGKLVHKGATLDGSHPAIVSEDVWHKVQDVLASRRIAGDRSWKHTHYLKGTLRCASCGSLLSFGYSHGRGGTYPYFFCLGRHTGRTRDICQLPYLPVKELEQAMVNYWHHCVKFPPELIQSIRPKIHEGLAELGVKNIKLKQTQEKRLVKLEHQKQKLIEAYLNDALPASELKELQQKVGRNINEAKRLIHEADRSIVELDNRLDTVLELIQCAGQLYEACSEEDRQRLNQCLFETVQVGAAGDATDADSITISSELTPPVAAAKAVLGEVAAEPTVGSKSHQTGNKHTETADCPHGAIDTTEITEGEQKEPSDHIFFTGGSNLNHLAEE